MRTARVDELWHRIVLSLSHLPLASRGRHRARAGRPWTSRPRLLLALGLAIIAIAGGASALAFPGSSRTASRAGRAPSPAYLEPIGALVRDGVVPPPALTGDAGHVGVPTRLQPGRPTEGNSTASGIAAYQGPRGTLTPVALATLALQQGCPTQAAAIAAAIAMAESGGSPSAQGDIALMDSVWDWSAGLWQIRGLRSERGSGALRDSIANQGVVKNAEAMDAISGACTDWTPWSTYNDGAYLQFMPLAVQAVEFVTAYYQSHDHQYPPVPAPDPTASIPAGYGGRYGDGTSSPATASTNAAKNPGRSTGGSGRGPSGTADQPTGPATTGSVSSRPPDQPQSPPVPTPSTRPQLTLPHLPLPTLPPLPSVVKSILPSLPLKL